MNNDALKWILKLEHSIKDRSGIYGYTQRTLAYNSNRIEGSTLMEEQMDYAKQCELFDIHERYQYAMSQEKEAVQPKCW